MLLDGVLACFARLFLCFHGFLGDCAVIYWVPSLIGLPCLIDLHTSAFTSQECFKLLSGWSFIVWKDFMFQLFRWKNPLCLLLIKFIEINKNDENEIQFDIILKTLEEKNGGLMKRVYFFLFFFWNMEKLRRRAFVSLYLNVLVSRRNNSDIEEFLFPVRVLTLPVWNVRMQLELISLCKSRY